MSALFHHAVVGGTFDHFHRGHAQLLLETCKNAEKVTIGISLPDLAQHKKYSSAIESFTTRQEIVRYFVKSHNMSEKVHLIPLSDIAGTTLTDSTIDSIFVTSETQKNAEELKSQRAKLGLSPIRITVVPFVLAEDGVRISSERIRGGEIDRQGHSYYQLFQTRTQFRLPENLRDRFQTPFGEVIQDIEDVKTLISDEATVITVGDIVSQRFYEEDIPPLLAVVDYKNHRKPIKDHDRVPFFVQPDYRVSNPPGTITAEYTTILKQACDMEIPQIVAVDGEEDLLVLPSILLAPLGSLIIYGQQDLGMVVVSVTEEKKYIAKDLLSHFS